MTSLLLPLLQTLCPETSRDACEMHLRWCPFKGYTIKMILNNMYAFQLPSFVMAQFLEESIYTYLLRQHNSMFIYPNPKYGHFRKNCPCSDNM